MKTSMRFSIPIIAILVASARADYTISADTTFGDGSEVTWGAAPFTGSFLFDFSGGGDSLTFYNPIQLNGNAVAFGIPAGKTVHLDGCVSNNVAFSNTSGYESKGGILRNESGDTGTLVFDSGITWTSLQSKYGNTLVKGSDVRSVLHYLRVWGGSSHITLSGGNFFSAGEVFVGGGMITITNCAFQKAGNSTYIGKFNVSHGTFRQLDATVTSGGSAKLMVGGTASGTAGDNGVYEFNGGSLNISGGVVIGEYGTGTFTMKNGTFSHPTSDSSGQHTIGNRSGSCGTMDVSGGTYQIVGQQYSSGDAKVALNIGYNGIGTLNLSGTGRLFIDRVSSADRSRARVYLGVSNGSSGTLNLNEGGTFSTYASYGIIGGAGTSALVFNGGTFEAAGSIRKAGWPNLVETNVQTVAVGPKGGVVDTKANDFRFMDPIVDLDPATEAEGFFWKRGSGTLTFHGANTYLVPTRVSDGNLALAGDGALSPNSPLWVDSGVTVDLSGATAQTVGGLAGKGTVSNVSLTTAGSICPGGTNEVGTLTLANCPLTLAAGSHLIIEIDADGNCDTLVVTGASSPLDLSNLTIEVVGADVAASKIGPIIQCAAGVTGTPTVTGTSLKALSTSASGAVSLTAMETVIILR